MNYNVIATSRFEKELKRLAKKYPSLKLGFTKLINDLAVEPSNGVIIGEGCYKIRIAIGEKVRGKSSGARVITYVYAESKTVYLLTIYDKSEKGNLKPGELKSMIGILDFDG